MDFGDFILKLTDDDQRRRENMAIKLEASQYRLKDWGAYWGVDRNDGRFHSFEDSRKELIMRIIFRLHESRLQALKTLERRYKISRNDQNTEESALAGDRLSWMIQTMRQASARVKRKGTWLVFDQAGISSLVQETMEMHENLQCLSYGSSQYIDGFRLKTSQNTRKNSCSYQQAPMEPPREAPLEGAPPSPASFRTVSEADRKTLSIYASGSVISSHQAGRIKEHINNAFDSSGDERIVDAAAAWWNNPEPGILVLEMPDIAEDPSPEFTCALLYYEAQCDKLIYTFDSDSQVPLAEQFAEMLRTLVLHALTLRDCDLEVSLPPDYDYKAAESSRSDVTTLGESVALFHQVLSAFATRVEGRLLLAINGMECICADTALRPLARQFFSALKSICTSRQDQMKGTLKALICCKGHAMDLYDCVDAQDVVDITDVPEQTVNLRQELAVALH
ncbi:hypothetical protein F4780DRAFT_728446 [Xylariomycetidae sp. FL0641]|nr:hypothetical protein F4780DRAFT_728446 [Xylariomycetidae sp. FL0641]